MNPLEKAAAIIGIALPLVAGAWWAGAGYIEFNDRLDALEAAHEEDRGFRARYEREQAQDSLVNSHVTEILKELEWLKYHHHDEIGGRGHVDG